MRVRTCGFAALALGILIGAGGCSSDSPTSPLAPAGAAMDRGGVPRHGQGQDTTSASVQGGLLNGGGRQQNTGSDATATAFGGLLNGGG